MNLVAAPRRWRFESLPILRGWSFWAFASIWTATLVMAMLANVMVAPGIFREASGPVPPAAMVGLSVTNDGSGLVLGPLIGPEAARSGLRRGDRLVAIDGRPVAATRQAFNAQLVGLDRQAGSRLTVTTLSRDGGQTDHLLTRDPGHYLRALDEAGLNASLFQWQRLISWLVQTGLFLGCAILLMARRSRDPLAPWASLMMLLLMISLGDAGDWFAGLFVSPVLAACSVNAAGFSMLGIVLTVFPTGRFEPRWSLAVAVFGTIAVVIATPLPNIVSNLTAVIVFSAAVAATTVR